MTVSRLMMPAATLAGALALAGCGGGSGTPGTTGVPCKDGTRAADEATCEANIAAAALVTAADTAVDAALSAAADLTADDADALAAAEAALAAAEKAIGELPENQRMARNGRIALTKVAVESVRRSVDAEAERVAAESELAEAEAQAETDANAREAAETAQAVAEAARDAAETAKETAESELADLREQMRSRENEENTARAKALYGFLSRTDDAAPAADPMRPTLGQELLTAYNAAVKADDGMGSEKKASVAVMDTKGPMVETMTAPGAGVGSAAPGTIDAEAFDTTNARPNAKYVAGSGFATGQEKKSHKNTDEITGTYAGALDFLHCRILAVRN